MIDMNDYLDVFPGAKAGDNIGDTEPNEITLNITTNGRSKKEHVHGFDCGTITKTMLICSNAWKLRKQFMKML